MLRISFEFDEVSQKVSNLKVTKSDSITKASTKTYDMEVDENKLILTSNAINKLGAVAGDRISVNYWTVNNETTYPIISKSDVFTEGQDGNKLTKKGTISFKGQQRTSLLKFGSAFTFSEFKDRNGEVKENIFVLTPVEDLDTSTVENSLEDEKEQMQEINTNGAIEEEIAEMLRDDEDSLPF